MKNRTSIYATIGLAVIGLAAIASCSLLGGCGALPTKLESTFATVETNYLPKVVWATNTVQVPVVVPLYVTNPVTVFTTNQLNQVTPVFSNIVERITLTNWVNASVGVPTTNMVPVYHETPNDNAKAAASGIGGAVDLFLPGSKGIVSTIALGIFAGLLGIRNRKWVAAAADATANSQALSQAAGVLTQIIETGREVLSSTPQGAPLANAFSQWMVNHQAATGTIQTISGIVKNVTDNEDAVKAAAAIQALMTPAGVGPTVAKP